MKNICNTLIIGAFLSIASVALSNTTQVDQAAIDAGKKVFMTTCFACHGADGKGMVPGTPNLIGKKSPLLQETSVLEERVLKGYQSEGSPLAMPPKGGNPKLTDQDISHVIAFMKHAFVKKEK